MKTKWLVAILTVALLLLGLVWWGLYEKDRSFSLQNPFETTGQSVPQKTVSLESDYPGYALEETGKWNQLQEVLEKAGFWNMGGVKSENGGWIAADTFAIKKQDNLNFR